MNKITKLFGIIAIASSTMLVACKGETGEIGPAGADGIAGKDGPEGPAGKDGVDGKDGAVNIQSYTFVAKVADWKETNVSSVGSGATAKWGVASYLNAAISTSKDIRVYVRVSDSKRRALPTNFTVELNNSYEQVNYDIETGRVDIMYRLQTQLFGGAVYYAPVKDLTFEVVLYDKTINAALKENNVDVNNYEALTQFLKSYQ